MKKFLFILLIIPAYINACTPPSEKPKEAIKKIGLASGQNRQTEEINPTGLVIRERFNAPTGFVRVTVDSSSFAYYLRHLPLKPHGASVLYHDGRVKSNRDIYAAVVDLPIGRRDLHQCADAVIRLRAEYLWRRKEWDKIHFNFTNGFRAGYSRWRKGERIRVNGSQVSWTTGGAPSNSYESFWKYLEMVFSYAGTLSLEKELTPIPIKDLQIGDVLIQGGSPGHAVIVVDLVKNPETGKKKFLIAQSYMPAQDIQVLENPVGKGSWYDAEFGEILNTPEWVFGKGDLRRVKDQ